MTNPNLTSKAALGDKRLPLPQGRIMGGSSAVNGMAFIANSKVNVDAWGMLGNPGWDWETLNPYYKKTYTLTLPSEEKQKELGLEFVDESVNGCNGPLQASFPDAIKDPIAHAWIESLRGLGYPMSSDPFSGSAFGGYTNAATIDPVTKTRSYSANAYYEPAKGRPNLHVITGALVEKVLFDISDGDVIATGVQYLKDGDSHTVKAHREVILSAGAFNSPKILELSGIGSRTILEKHNIPVLIDNPNVGENLQDHTLAGLSFEVQDFINTKDDLMRRIPAVIGAAMEDYKTRQFGPFTVGGNYSSALLPVPDLSSTELSTVLDTIRDDNSLDPFSADLAAYVRSVLLNPQEASGGYFTYPAQSDFKGSGTGAEVIRTKLPENYITIAVFVLHPLSRGNTHITSPNPADAPAIDPRYLTHPLDVELLARHARFIETIAASQPLSSMLKPGGKRSPGVPDDLRKVPLEEVKEYVKSAAKSTWHPTSTCAMMPREKGGVVDPRLRVWGTKRLRVVDASVIPIVTRGNSQSSVYAIAERAADLIKEDLTGEK
jgi:choline dehydrogenase-like flavoprotein